MLRKKGNANKRQRGEVEVSSSPTADSLPLKVDPQEETINEEDLEIKDAEAEADGDPAEISNHLTKPDVNLNAGFNYGGNDDTTTDVSLSINVTMANSSQSDMKTCDENHKQLDHIESIAEEKVVSHSISTATSETNLTRNSTTPLTIRKKIRSSKELSSMLTCGGGAAAAISSQAASGPAPPLPIITPNIHSTTPRVRPIAQV